MLKSHALITDRLKFGAVPVKSGIKKKPNWIHKFIGNSYGLKFINQIHTKWLLIHQF